MTDNTSTLLSIVDEMLLDAGETDPELRTVLLSLGAFASLPVPEPRAELAVLLSAQVTSLGHHRLRRRHRTAAVGLTVIAGMGLGVTGVAASASAPTVHASSSIQNMLQDWAPAWTIAGNLTASGAAGDLRGVPTLEPDAGDAAALAEQGDTDPDHTDAEHAGRGSTSHGPAGSESELPANAAPGAAERRNRHDSADEGAGNSEANYSEAGDPGAHRDASRTAGDGKGKAPTETPGRDARSAAVDGFERTGKLVTEAPAVVGNVASAIIRPPAKEKTGASDAGPGSCWLKKFNR
ncbi:MAG: hypothetical protein NVSMB43_20290 [Pseudarthrobacter sp.]